MIATRAISILVYTDSEEYADPSWERIEALTRSMNGKARTDVFLGSPEKRRYLAVSGANEGRYVVAVQEPTEWYCLVDSEKGREDIFVMVGGLPEYYPAAEVHDLETALAATAYYLETGERSPNFNWRRGGPRTDDEDDLPRAKGL